MTGNLGALSRIIHSHPNRVLQCIVGEQRYNRSLKLLDDILSSHPYAHILEGHESTSPHELTGAFRVWQDKVTRFRSDALLVRVPKLRDVLGILEGSDESFRACCDGEWAWASYTLATLLYKYPPPLTRNDLSMITERESMVACPTDDEGCVICYYPILIPSVYLQDLNIPYYSCV
jgi:Nup85 Nucleoporin